LYPAHLKELRRRTDAALESAAFDRIAVFSGRQIYRFLDDSTYAFKVSPHFKHWAPLLDAPDSFISYEPGHKPILHFYQPADYWHRPPELPAAAWLRQCDVRGRREPSDARAALRAGTARTAFVGEWQPEFAEWGFAATNPERLLAPLHYQRAIKTPYEIACMRGASAS